mmetsp:Transcript_14333/g.13904  ORF Transcript_14333/g.13904 Transcript_14333/m.13904 type:complete len:110 (+) Transcript_14333:559-888(+)
MNQFLIPKLLDRFQKTGLKGALINTQRHFWEQDINPCTSLYAATKAFNLTYNFVTNEEYRENIDQYIVNSQNMKSFNRNQTDSGLQNLVDESEEERIIEFELSEAYINH